MPTATKRGFYLKGRYLGESIQDALGAITDQERANLICAYLLSEFGPQDLALWAAWGMDSPEQLATEALREIRERTGGRVNGPTPRLVKYAGFEFKLASPASAPKSGSTAGRKAPAKKSANRAPARRR